VRIAVATSLPRVASCVRVHLDCQTPAKFLGHLSQKSCTLRAEMKRLKVQWHYATLLIYFHLLYTFIHVHVHTSRKRRGQLQIYIHRRRSVNWNVHGIRTQPPCSSLMH
jgi:hypothetical protein